jgi:FtsZ-binding cell division protein ZapB
MSDLSNTSKNQRDSFDFERLERAIAELLSAQRRLRGENEVLRQELSERDATVEGLDQEIVQLRQRRTDALKRLDDLIGQVDDFEALATQARG